MRIGGPFDTIKGPTVFREISICICRGVHRIFGEGGGAERRGGGREEGGGAEIRQRS